MVGDMEMARVMALLLRERERNPVISVISGSYSR